MALKGIELRNARTAQYMAIKQQSTGYKNDTAAIAAYAATITPAKPVAIERSQRMANAAARAKELKPRARFVAQSGARYEYQIVSPTSGSNYTVTITKENGIAQSGCTCKAGQNGVPCYHVAAVITLHTAIVMMRRAAAKQNA